jgi:hypothetical protein
MSLGRIQAWHFDRSYGTVVDKFKKWSRKLVEIARKYTLS